MSEIKQYTIEFLKVIGDQTRLEILDLLKNSEKSSAEIQETLKKSQSTISQHLKTLINTDLIAFLKKETILTVDNPKKPGETMEVPKEIKYYRIKNQGLFELLTKIRTFVIEVNKGKIKGIEGLDVVDTLL
jgi:DNA-binding transcriptional ArsR family regulator